MAERVSLKRRKSLKLQAERMRAMKARRSSSVQETVELSAETTAEEPLPGPSGLNESFLLPAPDADDDSLTESENESSDDDYDSADFRLEDAGVYQHWLATLERDDVKMMAMMLHDNYTSRFGLTKTSAAAEVAQLLGFNNKTMRLWRKDFLANKGE